MTTEEIEKAAEDYSKEYWREVSGMTNVEESIIYSMDNFKAGVEFADKHWQEKTKWIPVEERLPDRDKHVLWKTEGDGYFVMKLGKDTNFEWFKTHAKVTHWKEIE